MCWILYDSGFNLRYRVSVSGALRRVTLVGGVLAVNTLVLLLVLYTLFQLSFFSFYAFPDVPPT